MKSDELYRLSCLDQAEAAIRDGLVAARQSIDAAREAGKCYRQFRQEFGKDWYSEIEASGGPPQDVAEWLIANADGLPASEMSNDEVLEWMFRFQEIMEG